MLLQIDKLGKVAVTIEKDYWNINKDYDKLTVVEVADKFATYISRIPVPAGTELNNRKYWIPFSSLKEEIVIHYNEWINLFGGLLTSQAEVLNNIQKIINDIYTHLPKGIIFEGDIDVYDVGESATIHLTCTTTGTKPASEIKLYKNNTLIETWHNVTGFEIDETIDNDTEFRVEAVIDSWKYYGSWNVAMVYPFYIGTGTDVEDIIANEDYKHKGSEGLNGIYQVSPNDSDNIFIVAPKWVAIPEATMGGVKIPFDSATEYIIDEIVYYAYKSSNQYQQGNYSIKIGSVEYDKDSLTAELLNKVTDMSDEFANYDDRISEVERISGNREESSVAPTHMGRVTLPTHVVNVAYWALYTLTEYNQKMLVQVTTNGDIWIPFDEHDMLVLIQDDGESFTDLEIRDVRDISEISTNYLQFDLTSDVIVIPGGPDVKISDLGAAMGRGEITDYTEEVKEVNVLTQSMINKPNTIYVIQYDFTLDGKEITVPEGCVLKFEGGSLSNGTLVGNDTGIEAGLVKIFDTNIELSGEWNVAEAYPEWFGAKGDGVSDDTEAFNSISNFCKNTNIKKIMLLNKIYSTKTIILSSRFHLSADKSRRAIIIQHGEHLDIPLIQTDGEGGGHITIENITIRSAGVRTAYTVNIVNTHSTTIENCTIEKADRLNLPEPIDKNGIFIGRAEGYTGHIYMTRFLKNRINQCNVKIEGTDGYIAYNEIWGMDCEYGLCLDKTGNHMINSNQIIGGKKGCIYITGWSDGLKIYGNYFDGSSGPNAVDVPFGINSIVGTFTNNIIANNNFWHLAGTAISLQRSENTNIIGNTFQDCDRNHEILPDVYIGLINNTSVSNNVFVRTNFNGRTDSYKASPIIIDNFLTGSSSPSIIKNNALEGNNYYKSCEYPSSEDNYSVIDSCENNSIYFNNYSNVKYASINGINGKIIYNENSDGLNNLKVYTKVGSQYFNLQSRCINSSSLSPKFDFTKKYDNDFTICITSYNDCDNPPSWATGNTYLYNKCFVSGYGMQYAFANSDRKFRFRMLIGSDYTDWFEVNKYNSSISTRGDSRTRPTSLLTYNDEGYQYFDTDLGKPIYYRYNSGTPQWVDATGTPV